MRCTLLSAAFFACAAAHAMPLGLRTAVWGVARAGGGAVGIEDDPIPELAEDASPAAVAASLAGSADGGLAENIEDGEAYTAYREWVRGVTNTTSASAGMVKHSTHAWLSFALGADRLIGRDLTSNDVHIVSFRVGDALGGGAMGVSRPTGFVFEVAIDGVSIGGGSVAVETLKENLKKVMGVEGAAMLDESAFSSDNIEITFDAPIDGKARFTASPPIDAGSSFFMRVKVK